MIRISNLQLPLDHDDQALQQAVLSQLDISAEQLVDFTVFRRGYDARKKSKIMLIYTLDVETNMEEALSTSYPNRAPGSNRFWPLWAISCFGVSPDGLQAYCARTR